MVVTRNTHASWFVPVGTLVTVIYPDHCMLTRVVAHNGLKFFRVANDGTPMDTLDVNDEGSTWIRGHHVPSSPEASAAVTALALRGQVDPVDDTASVGLGPLASILGGLTGSTKNILMGALAGALGAHLVNHAKKPKGAAPTRIYKKP